MGDANTLVQYASHGAIQQMKMGNGLWSETRFNNRLQPIQIGLGQAATSGALSTPNSNRLLLEFGCDSVTCPGQGPNNGNVRCQNIKVGATTIAQTYTYDAFNRLATASETNGWSQTYGYDRYGNKWVTAGSSHESISAMTPTGRELLRSGLHRDVQHESEQQAGRQWV